MIIYLYVKQHSTTGVKYFGKTYNANPYVYKGSGSYWLKHINKHGKDKVNTLQVWEFDDLIKCSEFAIKFSNENNIVELNEWANLIIENGLDGGCPLQKQHPNCSQLGKTRSDEAKAKMRVAKLGKKQSSTHIAKRVAKNKGQKRTEGQKRKMIGRVKTDETKLKQRRTYGQRRANDPTFNTYWLGKTLSQEAKNKIRLSKVGKKHPVVRCPHCNKEGGQANMTRWHFNNCRSIIQQEDHPPTVHL